MNTLTITTKGQVTLPKEFLKHLGVHPGDKITVDKLPDGEIVLKRTKGNITDVFDFLKRKNGPSLSIKEMNRIVARGWAGRQ
jgi:AbrB family looped-hinge helix DNA binding protein